MFETIDRQRFVALNTIAAGESADAQEARDMLGHVRSLVGRRGSFISIQLHMGPNRQKRRAGGRPSASRSHRVITAQAAASTSFMACRGAL